MRPRYLVPWILLNLLLISPLAIHMYRIQVIRMRYAVSISYWTTLIPTTRAWLTAP